MSHRTFNASLFVCCVASAVAILAMPADAFDDDKEARAELRREMAEARMCIKEHGPGVAVVRDINNRTVCVPRTGKGTQ